MRSAPSLIGFVPDAFAEQMGNSPAVGLELPLEPGSDVLVRVRNANIAEVRVGPSEDGYTGLEVVLKPGASYELYALVATAEEERTPIFDPGFWYRLLLLRRRTFTGPPIYRPDAAGRFRAVAE